jgi:hypothetical protein
LVDQIAVVTLNSPVGIGTLDFTSPLITETFKGAFLIFSKMTTLDTDTAGGVIGYGVVTEEAASQGAGQGCVRVIYMRDNITTTTQTFHSTTVSAATCLESATDATVEVRADYDSAVAGGFRLNFTLTTIQVRVTAIIFAGVERASLGTASSVDSGSTHENVGNVGTGLYQPDMLICSGVDGSLGGTPDNGTPMLGFAVRSPLQQVSAYINVDRGTDPTEAQGQIRTDSCSCAFNADAPRTAERTVISSFDSTGFNHDALGASPHNFFYLAIKWSNFDRVRVAAANMAIAAATGNQSFNTFGFTPDVVLGISTRLTVLDTKTADLAAACSGGYFVTGRHGSFAVSAGHSHTDVTAGTPSDAHSIQGAHALMTLDDTGVVTHQADWVGGSGAGGFTLNFSTASQAGYMTALGIQVNYEAPRTQYRPRIAGLPKKAPKVKRPVILGHSASQAFPGLWRAVKRLRDVMRERLFRRQPPAIGEPVDTTPSAFDKEAEGSVFSAGAERGEVSSGGAEAGAVF